MKKNKYKKEFEKACIQGRQNYFTKQRNQLLSICGLMLIPFLIYDWKTTLISVGAALCICFFLLWLDDGK